MYGCVKYGDGKDREERLVEKLIVVPGIDDLLLVALDISWRLLLLVGRVRDRRDSVRWWNVLFGAASWIRIGSLTLFSFGFLSISVDDLSVFAHWLPTCLIPVLLLTGLFLLLSLIVVVVEDKGATAAEQRANDENHTDDDAEDYVVSHFE